MTTEQGTAEGFSYTLERTFETSVAAVWRAWTVAESYAQWSYAAPGSVEMDVWPGGAWKSTIVTPDGGQFPLTGSYIEVDENRRLVIGMDAPGKDEAGGDDRRACRAECARDSRRGVPELRHLGRTRRRRAGHHHAAGQFGDLSQDRELIPEIHAHGAPGRRGLPGAPLRACPGRSRISRSGRCPWWSRW